MKTLFIIFALLTWASIVFIYWLYYKDKAEEKPSKPVSEPEPNDGKEEIENPVTEPEKPQEQQAEEPKEEEPVESPVEEPVNEPVNEEPKEDEWNDVILDLIYYYSSVVNIPKDGVTWKYLLDSGYNMISHYDNIHGCFEGFYNNFFITDKSNNYFVDQLVSWLFGLILTEVVPEKRQKLIQMAYDYKIKGAEHPTYGWFFTEDPNNLRMLAAEYNAANHDFDKVKEMRKELGTGMIEYKSDISELFLDLTTFMPTAPFPFLDAYTYRPKGLPTDAEKTADIDEEIHKHISQYYTLDTKDKDKRQITIQSIANKEHKVQHLFGKTRTVTDPKYGEMTFEPVFGKHNLGIEIPDNGAIAALVNVVGMPCSNNRKSLLNQEYGRRRPGQGDSDPSANKNKNERASVSYAIEDGDGHRTGFYNKNGDYVDDKGNHIGDYETYYQGQLYANSYPSGHSAYIMGVANFLMMVMPDKALDILRAANEFAISRTITRYHWTSDTIHGRVIGTMFVPVLLACKNLNLQKLIDDAKKEYEAIISGDGMSPVDYKVNTSLSYVCGGYGSCHVDAGESSVGHCCNKEARKERHPFINVSQRVEFTIEGAGVRTADGKTSGVWEAGKDYELVCPAVAEGEEKIATITMRNNNGVRVLYYKLSWQGTHDDGAGSY